MARLDPDAGPLFSTRYPEPAFALGDTIYPVDESFDWSADTDVLTDAVRSTHTAIRVHTWAKHSEDRSWFACDCTDIDAHIGVLSMGLTLLNSKLLALIPDATSRPAMRERAPVVLGQFLRATQVFVLGLLGVGLLDTFAV